MRRILFSFLWPVLCMTLLCACAVPEPPSAALAENGSALVLSSDPESGRTGAFPLHRLGQVQFAFDNTAGSRPLSLTLHKRGFLRWSGPCPLNGSAEYRVAPGETAVLTLSTEYLTAGKYRFECQNALDGSYTVTVREAEYFS